MGRGRAPGRAKGGANRGVSFTALPIEEIFQDPSSDEDVDTALDETGFVVSSPSPRLRTIGAEPGVTRTDPSTSGQMGEDSTAPVVDSTQSAQKKESNSQKWGDMVEEERPFLPPTKEGREPQQHPDSNPAKGKKTWANVVGNRENGIDLNYVAPSEEGVVEFTQEDIEAGVSAWSTAIVGQVMGARPRFKDIVGFAYRAWSKIEVPRVHELQPGIFLFNFKEEESKRRVMARSWRFNQEQIILSDWSPDYKPATTKPTTMKVWIRLPDLNFQFWTKQGIEKIVSGVGIPISTDALTANRDALKFARALVEISLLKPYPATVKCKLPDGTPYVQKIVYEGLPETPNWDFGERKDEETKGKEIEPPQENVSAPESSVANIPDGSDLNQGTTQKKKKRNKKKKGNTSPAAASSDAVPDASVQERDATIGRENETSTATEVQEKGIPNAASPVNEEGELDPNKTKRNRKPNVRIWT